MGTGAAAGPTENGRIENLAGLTQPVGRDPREGRTRALAESSSAE